MRLIQTKLRHLSLIKKILNLNYQVKYMEVEDKSKLKKSFYLKEKLN